jgi:hypothetical protein
MKGALSAIDAGGNNADLQAPAAAARMAIGDVRRGVGGNCGAAMEHSGA